MKKYNPDKPFELIKKFKNISVNDVAIVGGKNSSLGEMFSNLSVKGINVPDGFATTSYAYWKFLDDNNIRKKLIELMNKLDKKAFTNLKETGAAARQLILNSEIPDELNKIITTRETHQFLELMICCILTNLDG